jgi:hypothetical protein
MRVSVSLTERVSRPGFRSPLRAAAACATHEQHRAQRRFAVLGDQPDRGAQPSGMSLRRARDRRPARNRRIARRWWTPSAATGPALPPSRPRPQDDQRILDIGAAPAGAGLGHLEIAPRRRAAALDLDAGRAQPAPCRPGVRSHHAGDVVVHHHHLVDQPSHCEANMPMVAEPQPTRIALPHAVDDRRLARLHDHDGRRRRRWSAPPARGCTGAAARRRSRGLRPCRRRSGDRRRPATASASRIPTW